MARKHRKITRRKFLKILKQEFQGNRLSLKKLSERINFNFENLYSLTLRLQNQGIVEIQESRELGTKGPLDIYIKNFTPPKQPNILRHPLFVSICGPLAVALIIWLCTMLYKHFHPS